MAQFSQFNRGGWAQNSTLTPLPCLPQFPPYYPQVMNTSMYPYTLATHHPCPFSNEPNFTASAVGAPQGGFPFDNPNEDLAKQYPTFGGYSLPSLSGSATMITASETSNLSEAVVLPTLTESTLINETAFEKTDEYHPVDDSENEKIKMLSTNDHSDGERKTECDGEQKTECDGEQKTDCDSERKTDCDGEQKTDCDSERKTDCDGELKMEKDGEQKTGSGGERKMEESDCERKTESEGEQKTKSDGELKTESEHKTDGEQKTESEGERKKECDSEQKPESDCERKPECDSEQKTESDGERKKECESEQKTDCDSERKTDCDGERKTGCDGAVLSNDGEACLLTNGSEGLSAEVIENIGSDSHVGHEVQCCEKGGNAQI